MSVCVCICICVWACACVCSFVHVCACLCVCLLSAQSELTCFFSGSRSGNIHHHDVRVASHHVATLASHTQEVCGLSWSPDGNLLASGGNDNTVYIWDTTLGMEVAPLHTFTEHQAAVKVVHFLVCFLSVLLFVGCLLSQQHTRVSQGRICSHNCACCQTEIEVTDQTFYLTHLQYTETGPTSPSADPITSGTWQGSQWIVNF